jgi:hypothetical protein
MSEDRADNQSKSDNGSGRERIDQHDQVLAGLVISLQAAAMQQMGKITNPVTGKIERDLQQARGTIDVLEMLKVKCRTSTPAALLQLLDSTVMELQMNYLDELKKEGAADAEPAPASEDAQAETDEEGSA